MPTDWPRTRVAMVALFAVGTLSTTSVAQVRDGSFAGTTECEALPRMLPLRTKVTMVLADGLARYEREIHHPSGGPSGIFERGEGPVTPSGDVTVKTRVDTPGYSYEAEYRGRIEEPITRLAGSQRWKLRTETGTIPRACTIQLTRVAK